MILQPIGKNEPNRTAAVEILQSAGIIAPVTKGATQKDKLRQALNSKNANIDDVAQALSSLLHADNENVRLTAAKTIAAAHGALDELGDAPPPVINITVEGNQGQQIINILMPQARKQVNEPNYA